MLRAHYSWNPIKCPQTQPSFSDSTETSHAGLLSSAFLKLYRIHWIIWLGSFNRVTFGFSMAQMELIINYLDALIKKKLHCGFMRVCWGARTRRPLVIFSFEWEWGLGRSGKGGYRIIFQEALKLKLGFIGRKRALQWRKWKGIQGNRILGPAKCISKNQWFSREPSGVSELIPFTWKLVSPMGWDRERPGLWNIGLTDTEGFISKVILWVESWMTRGKGSVSVSEQCGSEGITSLLFLFCGMF